MKWKAVLCVLLLILAKACADSDNEEEVEDESANEEQATEIPAENEEEEKDEDPEEVHTTPPTTPSTTTIPTTTLDYCHCEMEIYDIDKQNGTVKSPNFPGAHCDSGKCIYKILPHPNMTLRLEIETVSLSSGTKLKFWNIMNVNGKEYNVYHSEHGYYKDTDFNSYTDFTTAKNVGIKMVFEMQKNTYSYSGFKLFFARHPKDPTGDECPPAHVIIGEIETAVSIPKQFEVMAGCSFFLSPSVDSLNGSWDEMYIDIQNFDDTYVSVRSYDEESLFQRDYFSSDNRTKVVDGSRVEVMFRRRYYNEGKFKTPKITAKMMNQSCTCPPSEVELTEESPHVTLLSPGYQDLYCPSKHCKTRVISQIEPPKGYACITWIETDANIGENDFLTVTSINTGRTLFRVRHETFKPPKNLYPMVIGQQNLIVAYGASSKARRRYFDMTITTYTVPKECVCAEFDSKDYTSAGFLTAPISGNCTHMHCHWKFSTDRNYPPKYISLEFTMDHPALLDMAFVISEKITEEYNGIMLGQKNSFSTASSRIEFTFSRVAPVWKYDSILTIKWKFIEACTCPEEEFTVTVEEPAVITSPHFPDPYCPNLVCRHTFRAPEGHYLEVQLDEADIEKYHDFLKIYDGNSTVDKMLAKVTGTMKNDVYNSTTNAVFFVFISDESNSGRGYHANVYARPKPVEPHPGSFHWIIFILLTTVVLIASIGVACAVLRKTPPRAQPRIQNVENPNAHIDPFESDFNVAIPLQETLMEPGFGRK